MSPHSESIIYLSLSNLQCESIHSNLHLEIVCSKPRLKWESGRDLNICLIMKHRVSKEWQSGRHPLKFGRPWPMFGIFII